MTNVLPNDFDQEFQEEVLAPMRKLDLTDEALGEDGNFPLQILTQRTEQVFFSLQYYPEELKNGYLYCGVIDLSYPKQNSFFVILGMENDDGAENDFYLGEARNVVPTVDYTLQMVDEKPPGRFRPFFVHIDTILAREAALPPQPKEDILKWAEKRRRKALGRKGAPTSVRRAMAETRLNIVTWEESVA